MPTVSVDKEDLWERLEQRFSTEEFDKLCFDFGIELDEDTTEEVEALIKQGLPAERPQLKIEIPANRYDLLCIEGIARALRVFLGKGKAPDYRLVHPTGGQSLIEVTVAPETAQIRPYFGCAVLRNVKFTQRSYDSFIDLQDKLHQNICRKRQFVAIGTHDLDTISAPFRYEARPPKDIKFVPLNKTQAYTAEELMTVYESDRHLGKYLPIIRDSPVYPIIYDKVGHVLSMPPIINSERSKITLNTRNVFLDLTATDLTKLNIVTNIMVTMFSEYCEEPFTIEPVKVIYPDGKVVISPDLSSRQTDAYASYVNSCTGLSLSAPQVKGLLERMSLKVELSPDGDGDKLLVSVPPTRPDILHQCDVMEDAAIAYGFNNLPDKFPATSTVAQPLAVSKLCDIIRHEWAYAGWVEVLPLILCSHEENFAWLNTPDDGQTAVKIANPKTLEFQVVRTSLLPGLLKTIRENRSHALPLRIFEASDVVFKDTARERQARNVRHAAAVWCNKTAGFEIVHGLLDRAMAMLEVPHIPGAGAAPTGYYIKERTDPTFFPGRAATIFYRAREGQDVEIGKLGILHPSVLEKFEIGYPCSALEFSLEPFKAKMSAMWTNDDV
ncbi:phenylalanyl-tRNA synthetase subunit beta [Lactarius akahatsu]|uniref:Phenylalanine--tRNA ligase beta subunit n=1 Tax=Lactarius akahatsu TaxID=416441 RepID=A0AAD4LNG4_9AGAM|nr:phenylalanyl-tRNA synthetase subunit beta [Lactarius akahatsu]